MTKLEEALKIAQEGIAIHPVNSPEYKVCAALIQSAKGSQTSNLPEWVQSDQWIPVGGVIENENDDVFDIRLELAFFGQESQSATPALATRIAVLLNMSAGVSTEVISDDFDSLHSAFGLYRD